MPVTNPPTGITIHDPARAEGCYVLYDGGDHFAVLIDGNGEEVHIWDYSGAPPELIDPALIGGARGHIFAQKEHSRFANETLLELDWDGNVVWEWGTAAPGGKARQHHDQARLSNGNTLVLAQRERPVPELDGQLRHNDTIYEVSPEGELVWEWYSGDHLAALGFTGERLAALSTPAMRGAGGSGALLGFNSMDPLGPNHRFAAGDARFHPDNVMVGTRGAGFVAIIERATGDIVWNLGPDLPAANDLTKRNFKGELPRPVDCLGGQHDAHLIAEGLPGAGNVLLFDNQGATGLPPIYMPVQFGSRVLEIDPKTNEIVWQYDGSAQGSPIWSFFSSFLSSARRLRGGNTLICEGAYGRIFQVTPEGEIVWEFINPRDRDNTGLPGDANTAFNNQVYRAQPVPADWLPENLPTVTPATV